MPKSTTSPTDKQRNLARWVFATFMIFGGVLTICATLWLWARIDYAWHSVKVTATIVGFDVNERDKGPPVYAPYFQFQNAEGVVRVVKSQASYAEGIEMGKTVRVVYNPLKEEGLLIDRFSSIYGPPLFVSLFGLVWTIVSILGFRNASTKLPLVSEAVLP